MSEKRLYQNAFLERLAQTKPLFAIRLYIFIAVAIYTYGFLMIKAVLLQKLIFFLLGILFYTLIEYIFHRFLYHSGEDYKDAKNWQYKIHGIHHVLPKDERLLAMPIPLAILLGSVLFLLVYLLMGTKAWFFFPGLFLGYAIYLLIHYNVHANKPPNNFLKYLWKHHLIHHYTHEDKAFGVSSPLWDIIFRTMPPKRERKGKVG